MIDEDDLCINLNYGWGTTNTKAHRHTGKHTDTSVEVSLVYTKYCEGEEKKSGECK